MALSRQFIAFVLTRVLQFASRRGIPSFGGYVFFNFEFVIRLIVNLQTAAQAMRRKIIL
jgi:hypothetical protein